MSGLIDSYKKVYENKIAHIWLLVISVIWTIASSYIDIKRGNPFTLRQNPVDIIFNIIVGAYSLQFLYNTMNNINNGMLPKLKEIQPKAFWGVIKLNVIWGIYALIALFIPLIIYIATHILPLAFVVTLPLIFFAVFVYYIFLAYAENFSAKGLLNILLLFKFVKPAFKSLYIKLILFILTTVGVAAIYILIYTIAGLIGIDKIGYITDDFYFMDIIMNSLAGYFIIVTWYFAFPYSLINSYYRDIKPIFRKEDTENGENA